MKKQTISLMFSCMISMVLPAQENDNDFFKPDSNDIGFSFDLKGLINNISLNSFEFFNGSELLVLHKYIKEDLSLRFGFGINTINQKFSKVDSVFTTGSSQVQWDSTFTKNNIYFSPGIEKHLGHQKRLDPFIGAQIQLGILGKSHMKSKTITTDTVGVATVEITGNQDGGSLIGIRLITGFDFFFSPKLSIGAEYAIGFSGSTDGGDWSVVTIDTPASGTGTTKSEIGSDIATDSGIHVEATGGITLSYYFSRSKQRKRKQHTTKEQEQ